MNTLRLVLFCTIVVLIGMILRAAQAQELPVYSQAISGEPGNGLYMKSVQRRVERISFGDGVASTTLVSLLRRVDGAAETYIWDLSSGTLQIGTATQESKEADQRHVAGRTFADIENGIVRLWSTEGDVRPQRQPDRGTPITLSRSGGVVVSFASSTDQYFVWDASSGTAYVSYTASQVAASITAVEMSLDRKTVVVGTEAGDVLVSSIETGSTSRATLGSAAIRFLRLISPSLLLVGTSDTLGLATVSVSDVITRWSVNHSDILDAVYSKEANTALFISNRGQVWSASIEEGLEAHLTTVAEGASALDVSPDGRIIAIGGSTGLIHLWSLGAMRELVRLAPLESGWLAVTPDGHFDTNLISTDAVYWQLTSMSERVLPLDALTTQLQTPQLVPRVLANEVLAPADFKQISGRLLSARIERVEPDDAAKGTVSITVRVNYADGSTTPPLTGPSFDIRLFRDRRLVAQWPRPANPEKVVIVSNNDQGLKLIFRGVGVPLPTLFGPSESEFSVYAYNNEGVKGQTFREKYKIPTTFAKAEATAYIITVGVDSYRALPTLSFASNDAVALGSAFKSLLVERRSAATGRRIFGRVVWVPLISTTKPAEGRLNNATKRKIVAALKVLAGDDSGKKDLLGVPAAASLRQARAVDFVLVSFSAHGAIYGNQMYLMAADANAGELTRHNHDKKGAISSAELYSLMGSIDSGELALIIDACYSAAALGPNGLKFGTTGMRTLGELAYDKGIAVLAASQADRVAVEESSFSLGALTYALVRKGLQQGEADYRPLDGKITLSELFEYAASQLPIKHSIWIREARKDRLQSKPRTRGTANPPLVAVSDQPPQTPVLLNPQANDLPAIKMCHERCSCASDTPKLTSQQVGYIRSRLELGFSFVAGCRDLGLLPNRSGG
ncbi:WD40 repeat domain-containing protein [Bradyrhizobium sp. CCGB12]|uniref:WD40 repeat domain-containing protein n=1 Tax=Bradyrhizobium sp. CCGB12 TaxID=2949632 RepID=UPI0020B43557|nr:WD40 repeat domain-containing protein [Bradyrhizobium sp. CCGB12]MCP3395300.1 WD40 repeat domain-containing protein [Bradyrhizobium sp. CCGB12]